MKIGILHPRSNAHPGIGLDFADGMKAFLRQQQPDNELQLVFESIGFGGSEKEVYEKAERLLMTESADVLVAFIDLRVQPILEPLLYATGKLMIVVNAGANHPLNWVPRPNIVTLSLQHAFLCWLSGRLANEGARGLTATSFYDCGYLHIAAFVKGFEKRGGAITFNYVHNQPYNEPFDIRQLTGFLSAHKETDHLLCIFDTLPGSLFYKELNAYQDAEALRLLVSPMMLEQKAIESLPGGYAFAIEGYLPWQPALPHKANQDFTARYREETGRSATPFALLGWETALVLHQVWTHNKSNFSDGAAVVKQLTETQLDSPRGVLQLDPSTHFFIAPVYKVRVRPHTTEITSEALLLPLEEWKAFTGERTEGVTSGWMNTYLCY